MRIKRKEFLIEMIIEKLENYKENIKDENLRVLDLIDKNIKDIDDIRKLIGEDNEYYDGKIDMTLEMLKIFKEDITVSKIEQIIKVLRSDLNDRI
ncbi:hypothetical protein X275_08290 [Marinitoga sp. 1197]|uniref:hypothetical protein n=1 Tax=Marinitoga sp. 1197 TaxID=1428449 RepID=UPI0006414953|nr:hypothetical protein [Marinitoga sp. 1197]KLO21880.1 hypothetical protein X275_08290 [Marinitoga sp. 1197]